MGYGDERRVPSDMSALKALIIQFGDTHDVTNAEMIVGLQRVQNMYLMSMLKIERDQRAKETRNEEVISNE